ncbi:MAG: hypothetical protein OXB99_16880 [Acidimicrobiaceae bacterium]|nr:hypothetical protein [Acidimicrobiaceae bacterium]
MAARLSPFTGWITQRPGNAAANRIADHLEVIAAAVAKKCVAPTCAHLAAG